ncbi:MAG: GNAT family N-acetyltransferase [Robiginitomaculum sp.]|nr:GNAT family N-acetyltransferase [Robiginitomaculum sp.]
MLIKRDDLTRPEIQALLRDHLADAFANSPPGSVFALDLSGLQKPDISFWSVWDDDVLLGCGALKELDKTHGEIKSMRTTSAALRRGVGSTVLAHIIEQAQTRGYKRLSLETANNQPYAAARALYEKFGFEYCAPFADYEEGTFSLFMKLNL